MTFTALNLPADSLKPLLAFLRRFTLELELTRLPRHFNGELRLGVLAEQQRGLEQVKVDHAVRELASEFRVVLELVVGEYAVSLLPAREE